MTTIDFATCRALMAELDACLEELDGERQNLESNSKSLNAEKAAINRHLLYAAHVAKCVETEILSQYHRFKGEDSPTILPPTY